jgi:hypothetical protein
MSPAQRQLSSSVLLLLLACADGNSLNMAKLAVLFRELHGSRR